MFRHIIAGMALILWTATATAAPAQGEPEPFAQWLDGLRQEAIAKGIDPAIVNRALKNIEPIERVIELDRRQPEFTLTFWKYLNGRVTEKRIQRGRELLVKHRDILEKVSKEFGVQPRFLVSFWGLESNFGDYTGTFPLVGALATLSHDPRRSNFFREQLLAALKVMARGDIPVNVKSSWAGAMGNMQFIPTTYRDFAIDFDNNKKRDMWNSLPDIFASAANYLSRSGWQGDEAWGREVRLPKDFDYDQAELGKNKPISQWQRIGVRRIDGSDLPRVDIDGALILPAGYSGPAFLVYNNFQTILKWNRSFLYAIAVGHLADRLAGQGPLQSRRPTQEIPLSRRDIMDLQRLLTDRGFDTAGTDGVVGPQTRKAIKSFQRKAKLPADGYPTAGLLEKLRGAAIQ